MSLGMIFSEASSINDLLLLLKEYQSKGINSIDGPCFTSIKVELLINMIDKLRFECNKDEIYKSVVNFLIGNW